jgi:hypothetical protein
MTNQEINEAIAMHLGWLRPEHPDCMKHKTGWSMPEKWWMDPKTVLRFGHDIPNYCTDLNAIQEAEKATFGSSTQWLDFVCNLMAVLSCAEMSELDGMTCILQASARDHAEAFLRTIGKWKEESK